MDALFSVLGFVVVIGLLVTIHEWGHFQTARLFNIKVTHFSIGFGKPIWSRQRGETQYQVAMIPLGGYVKFADEREAEVAQEDLPRAFNRQSVYKRIAVVAAGPLINLLFAWLVFAAIQWLGTSTLKPMVNLESLAPQSELHQQLSNFPEDTIWELKVVDDKPVQSWQEVHHQLLQAAVNQETAVQLSLTPLGQDVPLNVELSTQVIDLNDSKVGPVQALGLHPASLPFAPIVGQVIEDSPAAKAGLQEQDLIVQIDNQPVEDWMSFVQWTHQHPNYATTVVVQRGEVELSLPITIGAFERDGETLGRIGIGVFNDRTTMLPYMNQLSYGFVDGLIYGWNHAVDMTVMTFKMLERLVFGDLGLHNLSGPLSIAQFSGQAIQSGVIAFLGLLGLLSLSIGLLNLLPIPVLDGGHLLYYIIEIFKGSPVSDKWMAAGQTIGLVLIMSLTFLALFYDVLRITNG